MRKCKDCNVEIPPETTHFYDNDEDEHYCEDCIKAVPYTGYVYYDRFDNFIGTSDDEEIEKIEDYEDLYEEVTE